MTKWHLRSNAVERRQLIGSQATSRRAPSHWHTAVGLILTAAALSGCKLPSFGAYRPGDTQSQYTFFLWVGLMFATFAVGGTVLGLIFWSIIRYRKRSDDDGSIPVQTHENIPWEIAYTVTPLVIVAAIFAATVVTENRVDAISPAPAVKVHVTAYRWGWIFAYQGTSVSVHTTLNHYPQLVLPLGETTQITLTSVDVVHEFLMPNYLFGRYAQPGVVNKFDFTPTKAGTFLGHCGVYCGLYHAEMLFTLRVVPPATYSSWLASQGAKAVHA